MDDEQKAFFDNLLKDLGDADQDALRSALDNTFPHSDVEERAIDRSVTSKDSYVFLWKDLLTLSDCVETAGNAPADAGDAKLLLLKALAQFWIKLRSIRVEITEDETKVLRAVKAAQKKKPLTMKQLPRASGLDQAPAYTAAMTLMTKMYQDKTPLLSKDGQEQLTTPF